MMASRFMDTFHQEEKVKFLLPTGQRSETHGDCHIQPLEWPNDSSDLNPMEHRWRFLKLNFKSMRPNSTLETERKCHKI